jgi:hypothetical protein
LRIFQPAESGKIKEEGPFWELALIPAITKQVNSMMFFTI